MDDAPGIEFEKDGTVNMYMNGSIIFSTKYTMATNGKSLMIHGPFGLDEPMSMEIISLSSKRLEMASITPNAFGPPERGEVRVFKPRK